MSTAAIDIARVTERLTGFITKIGANDPIDQYFPRTPALDILYKSKRMENGGRQISYPIDSGANDTFKDFSDYDVIDTSNQDTARVIVYPMVNKVGSLTYSWEELRENQTNDSRYYDLVKHRRDNAMKTAMDLVCTDLFAATQSAKKITSLNVGIDSTGSVGNLSQTDDSDWAAKEVGSGSFATQGLADMRSLWNQIHEDGGMVDNILTTRAVYEFYETEIDPDVRYAVAQTMGNGKKLVGGRGFGGGLEFNGVPVLYDKKCTSGVMFMWDSEALFMVVDTEGDFKISEFVKPHNQKVLTADLTFRGQVIITRRKSTGKLTSIVA